MQGIEIKVCRNSGECALCGVAPYTPINAWAQITCQSGGLVGDYLYLTNKNTYLQFCEIEVFGSGEVNYLLHRMYERENDCLVTKYALNRQELLYHINKVTCRIKFHYQSVLIPGTIYCDFPHLEIAVSFGAINILS